MDTKINTELRKVLYKQRTQSLYCMSFTEIQLGAQDGLEKVSDLPSVKAGEPHI